MAWRVTTTTCQAPTRPMVRPASGALKAWFKHGACDLDFWPKLAEPKPTGKVDWWDDGVRRPLGAYYRVERRSVVDIQAVLKTAASSM